MKTHRPPAVFVVTFDFVGMLEKLTGLKGWAEVRGPDSRCGLDYWYKRGRHVANINVDQNDITIAVNGDTICSGDYTKNKALAAFVTERPCKAQRRQRQDSVPKETNNGRRHADRLPGGA